MLYTITQPNGLRLGVNLLDVLAVEEFSEEENPAPGGVRPVRKKYLRLFLRNGASFTIPDDDRELYDRVSQIFKFGNIQNEDDADASS